MYLAIGLFLLYSLINVILQTMRHILTSKGNRLTACIINAVTYGFYALIIQQTAVFNVMISIPVTIVANLIGVYLAMIIVDKLKKDTIWKICVFINKYQEFGLLKQELDKENIAYHMYKIQQADDDKIGLDIYSKTQKESEYIKKAIKQLDLRYCITETRGNF